MTNDVVTVSNTQAAPSLHASPLNPRSFQELMHFAEIASTSGMVPTDYAGKPGAIVIACQMGAELGLAPMQSLQNIAVINGRPSVWGDTLLALVRASPVCDDVVERIEGTGDGMVAICVATRKGKQPVEGRFSMAEARTAGLANKTGPWKTYPRRMLQMRARGFALRDAFPDVLRGLITAEEAQDMPVGTLTSAKEPQSAQTTKRNFSEEKRKRIEEGVHQLIDEVINTKTREELERLTSDPEVKKRRAWINDYAEELAAKVNRAVSEQVEVFERQEARQHSTASSDDIQEMPA